MLKSAPEPGGPNTRISAKCIIGYSAHLIYQLHPEGFSRKKLTRIGLCETTPRYGTCTERIIINEIHAMRNHQEHISSLG